MTLAEPPISSFGKLAELALDHPDWPAHTRPKPRSLSTLFSKLDRKQDLDWLRDRIEIQQLLGQLLKRSVTDIRGAIGEVQYVADDRFLRLSDIRYARELDLTQEELPPGIPRTAIEPPSWAPTWWLAPPGSGRSMVATWLRSRGLSHSVNIRSREELERLPTRGPLFIELDSLLEADELQLTQADLSALRAHQRPVCIAASFAPPPTLKLEILESAPPLDYLPELVDWVAERLDGSGHYQADRAEQWMRRVAIPAGAVTNFGDALGLLGMIDEVHPRSLLAKSLDELGEHFVKRRVREANEKNSVSPRLSEEAFPALQECAARVLVSGKNALHAGHPVDEWTALLSSPQNEDVPDPEWFTAALRGALGAQISRRDLRRAARKLQPGAFQLVRSLEAAQILVRSGQALSRDEEGALRQLRPRWLVSLLSSRAAQEVLRLAPSQWGSVLWVGHDAARLLEALLSAARLGDFSAPFSLADDFEAELPPYVAALEASVIACGMAALEGYDVPDELIDDLLNQSAECLLVLDGIPYPRLTLEQDGAGLFRNTFWRVAMLALCQKRPFPLEHLDPIRTSSTPLRAAFARDLEQLLARDSPFGAMGSGRANGVLTGLNDIIPRDVADTPATLPRPTTLRFMDHFEEASPLLFESASRGCWLDYLVSFAMAQGKSERRVLSELWRHLASTPNPSAFFSDKELARKAWSNIPDTTLRERARAGLSVDWDALLPHQYAEWLVATPEHRLPREAAERCPLDAALRCLEDKGASAFEDSALEALIGRGGARFSPFVKRALEGERLSELEALLQNTPRQASAALAQELPDTAHLLNLGTAQLRIVRLFLSRAVRERHPSYELCYQRLMSLEQGLSPLRRLS